MMNDDELDEDDVREYKLWYWLKNMSIGECAIVRQHWSYNHGILKEDDPEKGIDQYYSLKLIKLVDKETRYGYFERFKFKYVKSKQIFWTGGIFVDDICGYIEPLEFTNWAEPELDLKALQMMHFRNQQEY